MIRKILVAYDSGDKAKKALDIAIDIAGPAKAEIHLVAAVKMPEFVTAVATPEILKDLDMQSNEYFTEILKEPAERVGKEGIPVVTAILQEKPGEAIVRYAEREGMDLIVMGSANRGKLERMLLGLGSVSNYTLQHAKCPVVITKG